MLRSEKRTISTSHPTKKFCDMLRNAQMAERKVAEITSGSSGLPNLSRRSGVICLGGSSSAPCCRVQVVVRSSVYPRTRAFFPARSFRTSTAWPAARANMRTEIAHTQLAAAILHQVQPTSSYATVPHQDPTRRECNGKCLLPVPFMSDDSLCFYLPLPPPVTSEPQGSPGKAHPPYCYCLRTALTWEISTSVSPSSADWLFFSSRDQSDSDSLCPTFSYLCSQTTHGQPGGAVPAPCGNAVYQYISSRRCLRSCKAFAPPPRRERALCHVTWRCLSRQAHRRAGGQRLLAPATGPRVRATPITHTNTPARCPRRTFPPFAEPPSDMAWCG